jgi:hypothetical protein
MTEIDVSAYSTNRLVRLGYGLAADYIREGLSLLGTVTQPGLLGTVSGVPTTANYSDIPVAKANLDGVNQFAMQAYALVPDDDNAPSLETITAFKTTAGETADALIAVQAIVSGATPAEDFIRSMGNAVTYGTGVVADAVNSVEKAAAKLAQGAVWDSVKAVAPLLAIVAGAILVLWLFRKEIDRLLGVSA